MRLMREVRLNLGEPVGRVLNSWAGWPVGSGLEPYLVLRVEMVGTADHQTGFLCNILEVDQLIREQVYPQWWSCFSTAQSRRSAEQVTLDWFRRITEQWNHPAPVDSIEVMFNPALTFRCSSGDRTMIQVTHSFEFSAAHRLYCAAFSDQQNQNIFGKCSNLNGHGHNYVLDVTLAGQPDPVTGLFFQTEQFQHIVKSTIIDRFDHKHLNLDCVEFQTLNPTVENIAHVIWNLLVDRFLPGRLHRVRVWETPKTYAEILDE